MLCIPSLAQHRTAQHVANIKRMPAVLSHLTVSLPCLLACRLLDDEHRDMLCCRFSLYYGKMTVPNILQMPACRLRDDARKDPAVLSYLKEENAYTAAAMADTQQLQDALYTEMRARIQEEDTSVATRCGFCNDL